ncbi:SulP family inorganic anion transporter [Burkholderia thailandensis]|uniref:Sulfate transporter family protein n=1 Tax=Burkholderia thailandensis TaxID=57975 RepID=A0AAW9CJ48_BURTH|nr:SulP family inorganic anion transporter [Burkholderia thailandensis]MCS3395372.1 SulP family inorganic anion transporter [Burkholderia thailandensis]MCS6428866.1 SulP family inorganic anion transporter [Burkholderia thailandensis]MCS6455223.1 SulP family inorganic anion transporter [Burkholderia thailandensis]MCS6467907.1 SulP family inorganic anion transporter [Burkholderia thailandensis]MCS6486410.1 SulP family inorganic anion transporter [Burkholderia thailandensis]
MIERERAARGRNAARRGGGGGGGEAWRRWLPGVATLRAYPRAWLARDLYAGVALTAVLVPVGMSYAQAAGLPVIAGLNATIAALLGYAIFGPSRILVLGPDSALTALIAGAIAPLAHGEPAHAVALAAALALMSGGFCVLAGLLKLGFVTDLLSKPIQYGYLNGLALTLIASQLPGLLGATPPGGAFVDEVAGIAATIAHGRIDFASLALGGGCLAGIVLLRRVAPAWPGMLIAVAGASIVAAWLGAAPDAAGASAHVANAHIALVGSLAGTLPPFGLPSISLADASRLVAGALAIALVSVADISVLSRVFAQNDGSETDRNQELIALGAANLLAGALRGCAVTSSSSRTPVALAAGARTQLTSVVAAACIALLLVAPTLLARVPLAALAAVVVYSAHALVDVRAIVRLYRVRRGECAVSVLCFAGVVLLGVVPGILLAVGLSLLSFVWRAWHPYDAVLGRVEGMHGYHDVSRHPEARRTPGLVAFRWDAPLFHANATIFRDHVRDAIAGAEAPVRCVVIAAEPITDVDVTAADMLATLRDELAARRIALVFAEMKGPVKDRLRTYGLFDKIGADHFFPTVTDAIAHFAQARKDAAAVRRARR